MTDNREKVKNDPGAGESFEDGLQGYAAHYCEVPKRHEPGALACSFILSGLRLFDIRDPFKPKEIAYFNGPAVPTPTNAFGGTGNGANYAMSKPAMVPARGELWYTDGHKGFYAVKVTNGVWPFGGDDRGLHDNDFAGEASGTDRDRDRRSREPVAEPDAPDEAAARSASQEPRGGAQPFTGAQLIVFFVVAGAASGTGALVLRLVRGGNGGPPRS